MTNLDAKLKATVIDAVLSGEYLQPKCEVSYVEGDDGRKHYQAVALSTSDPNVACVFSLPTEGRNIYVTVTDGDREVIGQVLATLEDLEVESSIHLGNVQLLDSPELRKRDIVGVILLMPRTSNALKHLPLDITVGNTQYRFLLVVFLSTRENEVRKTQGHDALMDFFSSTGKDLVSFGAPLPSG